VPAPKVILPQKQTNPKVIPWALPLLNPRVQLLKDKYGLLSGSISKVVGTRGPSQLAIDKINIFLVDKDEGTAWKWLETEESPAIAEHMATLYRPAWPGSAKPAPAHNQDSSTQVPAQKVPAPEVPAPKVPPQKVPAQKMPVQKVPAQNVPAQKVPAQKVPAQMQQPTPIYQMVTTESDARKVVSLLHESILTATCETLEDLLKLDVSRSSENGMLLTPTRGRQKHPVFAVDCEGVSLSATGKLTLLQVAMSAYNDDRGEVVRIFIFDILAMGSLESLRGFLESEAIIKVMHDVHMDAAGEQSL
jgi:hypothetical protein